jgi:hypothetical protein
MKHIRISAREILTDIRTGMSDGALMEKYGLSVRSLPKIKDDLLKQGLATPADLGCGNGCPVSEKISISAKSFITSFRETPDDFALMEKYSLNPGQLQQVYEQLLGKGLLMEYEFHNRDCRSPELKHMELPEIDETTAVDLTQELSGSLKDYHKIGNNLPSIASVKRVSWVEDGPLQEEGAGADRRQPRTGSVSVPCPQCGRPRAKESPETCQYCGVVFAKVKGEEKRGGPAVWD